MIRRQRVKPHEFITEGPVTVIVCYGMKGQETGKLIIDTVNLERVSKEKWCVKMNKGNVAAAMVSSGQHKNMKMHHFLFGKPPAGFEYDHKNRNPLDNREENVRVVTAEQNQWNRGLTKANSSGFKGVRQHENGKGWTSIIWHTSKPINIGYYPSQEEAIVAYNLMASELRGDFGWENEISDAGFELALEKIRSRKPGMRRDNKSGHRGVYYDLKRNKWAADIRTNGKTIHVGRFDSKEEAARAYNKKALELFGENAYQNAV
jgi:hypothetical protein